MVFYTHNLKKIAMTTLLMLPLIAGCATGGNVRLSDAALAGDPNAMWEDGKKSAETGEDLVSKGEKRLTTGRKQVRDGEALIRSGKADVLVARQDYEDTTSAIGASLTPKQVDAEAKRLKAVGDKWEDSIKKIRKGNAMVDKGNKAIDRGHSEIREGRALMESGSTLMRNSQRSRLNQGMLSPRSNR